MAVHPPRIPRFAAVSALAAVLLFAAPRGASADVYYGATGSNGINGRLYILNPANGAIATNVGALVDAANNVYGLTGLAFQPGSGTLYGSTSNASLTGAGHLVRVNVATGQITDVGSYGTGTTMADITFDPTTGQLYGLNAAGDQGLYRINTATGAATFVGGASADFGGSGLAASLTGTLFATPDGVTAANPTLQTINKATGVRTVVGTLSGATFPVHNALDFNSTGVLYGVESNRGGPTSTRLVTINTATAVVTVLGTSVPDLDALAIFRTAAPGVPEPSQLALAAVVGVGLLARRFARRRKT